jgi:hypothetical protein
MIEKLLAAGAYTIGNQIDYRTMPSGRCINLGYVDAQGNVTIVQGQQDFVNELLYPVAAPQADPVEVEDVQPRKRRKSKSDTTEDVLDDPSLGSLVE